jgi:tetratricopeptide (TPR) repeat protein
MKRLFSKYFLTFLLLFLTISLFAQKEATMEHIKTGIKQMHANQIQESLKSFDFAQKEIQKNYTYKEQFLIYNNLGLIYYKMDDHKKATSYYQKAYNLASEQNSSEDVMTVLNNIAVVYIKLKDYPKAEKYLKEAYDLSKSHPDKIKWAIYGVNLASVLYEQKEFAAAENYLVEVQNLKIPDLPPHIFLNHQILWYNLLLLKENPEKIIRDLEKLQKEYLEDVYTEEQIDMYLTIAKAYKKKGDPQKSLQIYENLLKENPSYEKKTIIFDHLAMIYFELNDIQNAFLAKDSVMKYHELIQKEFNEESLENARLNFDLKRSQDLNETQKSHFAKERNLYLLISFLLILLLATILYIAYKKTINDRNKQKLIEQNLRLKEFENKELRDQMLHQSEELWAYKEKSKDIENQLEKTTKQFSQEFQIKDKYLEQQQQYLKTRNELLKELLDELLTLQADYDQARLLEAVHKLRSHLQVDVSDEHKFLQSDKQQNHLMGIFQHIYPQLKSADVRLLTLLYLQVETKEIAQLLFISADTVRKRKERLKTKLGLEKSLDLNQYLQELKLNFSTSPSVND